MRLRIAGAQCPLCLIEGIELDKSQVPVNGTECAFGQWYYGDGQQLRKMPGFQELEAAHDALHTTYRQIFVLLFGKTEKTPSFFSRLFGTSANDSEENKEKALEKYKVLERQSSVIRNHLIQLENMIDVMGEEQLSRYISEH
ncbi:MAG: CZB domain-containing protein [Mariprofundaceae bacterium]|nr:CZB domain-containing protein [Mariprofundaceae bacterium]